MNEKKPWYASKTIWVGVLSVGVVAYNSAVSQFGIPPIPEFVYAILGAIGVGTRSTATKRIGTGK